jgi:hypothetical protein
MGDGTAVAKPLGGQVQQESSQVVKSLTNELKRALAALAGAEAGEMLSRRHKMEWLEDPGPGDKPPSAVTRAAAIRPNRQVALGLGERLSATAVDYAIGLCRRMEAGLALISGDAPDRARSMLGPHVHRLEGSGIAWNVVSLASDAPADLERYIHDNPQVLLMVSSSSDDMLQRLVERGQRRHRAKGLQVPLVVLAQDADRAA